ncbi:hypothetical protein EJ06DRAFT_518334 [Trichodelitschia bisporula]|uniref:Uncharacterized protein n=1 Tax=Trichodelitschia bisporula TaxID=703511 RepID=A0A6G1IAP5_9PEZI|nr:hypothetical protein EJ06DRAFT_518334 [Trichodelitschia bisporula]
MPGCLGAFFLSPFGMTSCKASCRAFDAHPPILMDELILPASSRPVILETRDHTSPHQQKRRILPPAGVSQPCPARRAPLRSSRGGDLTASKVPDQAIQNSSVTRFLHRRVQLLFPHRGLGRRPCSRGQSLT